jgi:hypothetical protein
MSETPKTGFVIQVASPNGQAMWLGPFVAGHRAFGARASAQVFTTQSDAHAAIGKIPLAFDRAGFVFSVEAVEEVANTHIPYLKRFERALAFDPAGRLLSRPRESDRRSGAAMRSKSRAAPLSFSRSP